MGHWPEKTTDWARGLCKSNGHPKGTWIPRKKQWVECLSGCRRGNNLYQQSVCLLITQTRYGQISQWQYSTAIKWGKSLWRRVSKSEMSNSENNKESVQRPHLRRGEDLMKKTDAIDHRVWIPNPFNEWSSWFQSISFHTKNGTVNIDGLHANRPSPWHLTHSQICKFTNLQNL